MSNALTFSASAPVSPGISIEQLKSSNPTIPAVTQESARAALEHVCRHELPWLMYEENHPRTWGQVVQNLRGFLVMLWVKNALQGNSAQEAFFIRCDHTTMTQTDHENGLVICEVGMAPVRPSEFVTFRIRIQLNPRP